MSKLAPIAILAAAACVALPVWATAAPNPSPLAAVASDGSVELLECKRGKRAPDRNALFRGEMRSIAGSTAMRMRFQLGERVGRGPWRAVDAPALDIWRYARPGVGRFAYRQRIAALAQGTSYRVWVTFQWHDAAGEIVSRQAVRSAVCRQPGPLPNVRVGKLASSPGPTAGSVRYAVSIANSGGAPARRVEVRLSVDGSEVDTRRIGIAAHGSREIGFVGPACVGEVTVEADPNANLREIDRRDNRRKFACPAAP
jgi:hypothetical protein